LAAVCAVVFGGIQLWFGGGDNGFVFCFVEQDVL
jgi:type IV secretory pathway VirB2 component (pilin)